MRLKIALSILTVLLLTLSRGSHALQKEGDNASEKKPGKPLAIRINPKDGAELVWIPPGEFTMGTNDATSFKPEGPSHKITLDGYWIYRNVVTVAQYRKYCEATGRKMPDAPKWGWKDDHPMVYVTWKEAVKYCDWAGAQLPTEAQWEKAARGEDGRRYPWGDTWDAEVARASKIKPGSAGSTAPAGSFPKGASPYGVLDMAGNVFQWCSDWYDPEYYQRSPQKNPTGPETGMERVIRGGGWNIHIPNYLRTTMRFRYEPDIAGHNGGFRCVVIGEPPTAEEIKKAQ
jgi:formylglycine-generating enzyme required for sulfatase activity